MPIHDIYRILNTECGVTIPSNIFEEGKDFDDFMRLYGNAIQMEIMIGIYHAMHNSIKKNEVSCHEYKISLLLEKSIHFAVYKGEFIG